MYKRQVLNIYIPKYGPVKKILSDQGKQFTNKKWQSELEKHSIQAVLTAIRRPQGNLAERVTRELGRLFCTYSNTNQCRWPDYLEFFEASIKGNYSDTTVSVTNCKPEKRQSVSGMGASGGFQRRICLFQIWLKR